MKKLLIFALLLIPLAAFGWGIMPLGGGSAVTESSVTISDNFNTDTIADWTQESGSWSLSGNALEKGAGAKGMIYHETEMATVNHYVSVKLTLGESSYLGPYFRYTGDTADRAYCVRLESLSTIAWRTCLNAECSTIEGMNRPFANGDWIGIEVSGTGSSTTVDWWDFGASDPGARSTWGAATGTFDDLTYFTSNPTHYADTGKFTGLYNGNVNTVAFDDFQAGDSE